MSNVSRRRALILSAGLAAGLVVPGWAEAKPTKRPPRPPITRGISDKALGVDVRTINLVVGTPPTGVSAPVVAFTLGTQVGVPTGTSLTDTTGLPAADATESLTLTHPISGAQTTKSVSVWRRRRWTSLLTFTPPSGATYLFDECEYDVSGDSWTTRPVNTNAVDDQMQPQVVWRRCTFDGNNTCGRALQAGYSWVLSCHATGAADAMGGGNYCVVQDSNLIATTDTTNLDPHSDGFQCSGDGNLTMYHNWIAAGTPGASGCIRMGTESSANDNVKIWYNTVDQGNYGFQFRGDAGAGDNLNFDCQHNRWTGNQGSGSVDSQQTTYSAWVDNKKLDGTVIPQPP